MATCRLCATPGRSHKSYTATKPLKLFLAFLSLFVGQGGPLDWAYVHRLHHRICEHELDYHSPHPMEVRGFWYAQAAWMVTPHEHVVRSPALEKLVCADIVDDPDLAFFHFVGGERPINKLLIGMVAPGVTLALGYVAVHALRERRRLRQSLDDPRRHAAAASCWPPATASRPTTSTFPLRSLGRRRASSTRRRTSGAMRRLRTA